MENSWQIRPEPSGVAVMRRPTSHRFTAAERLHVQCHLLEQQDITRPQSPWWDMTGLLIAGIVAYLVICWVFGLTWYNQ